MTELTDQILTNILNVLKTVDTNTTAILYMVCFLVFVYVIVVLGGHK